MKAWLILFFVLHFSFFILHGNAQDVSFYKENITMRIGQGYFYVTGNYFLRSGGAHSLTLVYPFPVDQVYGEVDSLAVHNLTTGNPLEILSRDKTSAVFKAEFGGEKETEILVAYRQKLLGGKAEYILETTKSWRKPLEQADYQLIVPAVMEILSFSIPPDESLRAGEDRIYYWFRKNFMPVVNLIFEFK